MVFYEEEGCDVVHNLISIPVGEGLSGEPGLGKAIPDLLVLGHNVVICEVHTPRTKLQKIITPKYMFIVL